MAVLQNSPRRATLPTSPVLTAPLGIAANDLLSNIRLYPNPANEFVFVNISEGQDLPDFICFYNTLGQQLSQVKVSSSNDLTINIATLSKGIYFLKINKDTASKTLQFIKN